MLELLGDNIIVINNKSKTSVGCTQLVKYQEYDTVSSSV